jgi:hypothetical protein
MKRVFNIVIIGFVLAITSNCYGATLNGLNLNMPSIQFDATTMLRIETSYWIDTSDGGVGGYEGTHDVDILSGSQGGYSISVYYQDGSYDYYTDYVRIGSISSEGFVADWSDPQNPTIDWTSWGSSSYLPEWAGSFWDAFKYMPTGQIGGWCCAGIWADFNYSYSSSLSSSSDITIAEGIKTTRESTVGNSWTFAGVQYFIVDEDNNRIAKSISKTFLPGIPSSGHYESVTTVEELDDSP